MSSPHCGSSGDNRCTRIGLGNRIGVTPTVALGPMGFTQVRDSSVHKDRKR